MKTNPSLLAALLFALSSPAFAVYKCVVDGQVTYTDAACEGGKPIDIRNVAQPDAAATRREVNLEKSKLKKLEGARHKNEAAEQRELHKAEVASAAKRKKCTNLERKQQRAKNDAAAASGKAAGKAAIKARRAKEDYEGQCGQFYERELGFAR